MAPSSSFFSLSFHLAAMNHFFLLRVFLLLPQIIFLLHVFSFGPTKSFLLRVFPLASYKSFFYFVFFFHYLYSSFPFSQFIPSFHPHPIPPIPSPSTFHYLSSTMSDKAPSQQPTNTYTTTEKGILAITSIVHNEIVKHSENGGPLENNKQQVVMKDGGKTVTLTHATEKRSETFTLNYQNSHLAAVPRDVKPPGVCRVLPLRLSSSCGVLRLENSGARNGLCACCADFVEGNQGRIPLNPVCTLVVPKDAFDGLRKIQSRNKFDFGSNVGLVTTHRTTTETFQCIDESSGEAVELKNSRQPVKLMKIKRFRKTVKLIARTRTHLVHAFLVAQSDQQQEVAIVCGSAGEAQWLRHVFKVSSDQTPISSQATTCPRCWAFTLEDHPCGNCCKTLPSL